MHAQQEELDLKFSTTSSSPFRVIYFPYISANLIKIKITKQTTWSESNNLKGKLHCSLRLQPLLLTILFSNFYIIARSHHASHNRNMCSFSKHKGSEPPSRPIGRHASTDKSDIYSFIHS